MTVPAFRLIGPSLCAVAAITALAVVLPIKLGLNNLERIKETDH
ncbi:MAG TPA: hypothetical protein VFU31_02495 [Candidatus Binatia bacterium]|nr:hypothetical protein [Candidatus Binatia bacterium]